MDAECFDTLTRMLTAAGSRRRALAALSGAFGLLSLAHPQDATAATSGKCTPKCGECEKCQKGDCDKKNGKKRCQQGTCKPKAEGTGCSNGACQGRRCVAAAAPAPLLPPPPPPPPPPQACREAARRNFCPITGTCMANCPAGTVFIPESCTCQ